MKTTFCLTHTHYKPESPIRAMKDNKPALWLCWASIALSLALTSIPVEAANSSPPELMTYQGFLVDNNAVPLGNTAPKNYDVVFKIYTDQLGGTLLWAEQQTITIDKGYFSVLLGEGTVAGGPRPALSSLFTAPNASDRYVEIVVKGIGPGPSDVTITPRLRFLASPYAFLTQTAVNAQNLVNGSYAQVVNISGNNVGINKASPTSALDVSGVVTATTFSGSGSSLTSLNANNLSSGIVADVRLSANVARLNAAQTFTANNSFSGNLTVGGDVQIGTSSADYQYLKLGGGNSSGFLYGSYYGLGDGIHLGYNYYYDAAGAGRCIAAAGATSRLTVGYGSVTLATGPANTAPVPRIFVNAAGDVGIGTTTPDRALTVKSSGSDSLQWVSLKNSSGLTKWHINHTSGGVNFSETGVQDSRLFLAPGGKVGINTGTPTVALHVIGQVKISDLPIIGDERNVQWDETTKTLGRLVSSRRYKENIQPMEEDWSALLSAQPVSFTFIGQPDRLAYGFIAEELDELGLKPLVVYDEAGRPDGVRYEKVALYLLEIVKAQQEELKEKDTRLKALEQSVTDLKTLVSALVEKVNASEN